ncbi:MAG TPA: hypothetical protein DEA08_15070 [Planctomycetes bacterium]|nr:hypothetical protein [Planctomycetota bacterium]
MVDKGQLLERPVVIPSAGICLDGIYLRGAGSTPLLVASPLPGSGGSMASPIGNELAYAAAYAGCASLRLDYAGVGASEGEPSGDVSDAAANLSLGLDFLLETTGAEAAAAAGIGSGAFAALELARRDERIDRLVLVAPPWEEAGEDQTLPVDLPRPTLLVVAGDEPGFDYAREEARAAALHVRLEVLRATRSFRAALAELARLVPPFLGAERPERPDELGPRRGRLF